MPGIKKKQHTSFISAIAPLLGFLWAVAEMYNLSCIFMAAILVSLVCESHVSPGLYTFSSRPLFSFAHLCRRSRGLVFEEVVLSLCASRVSICQEF